jgi:ABC-type multidrug transport system ATPase subunit
MGSSGAGKTTLMDVIAGRKTAGTMTGQILVCGYPKNQATFSKLMGYAEQQDLHMPFATVYESLMFAAQLRLPSSVTHEERVTFVNDMMVLLELDHLRDRIVGDESAPVLSPAQKKYVCTSIYQCQCTVSRAIITLDNTLIFPSTS